MQRIKVYLLTSLLVVLLGLLVGITPTQAAWFRAGDGFEIFEVTRVCRDGFSIRGASNSAGYDKPIYARMYDSLVSPIPPGAGSYVDPGQTAVPGEVIATGIVPIPDVPNPGPIGDGGEDSLYIGSPVDIPWSVPFNPNIPYVAVFWGTDPNVIGNFIAGFIIVSQDVQDCLLFPTPPPPNEPDHQPPHHPSNPHNVPPADPSPVHEPPTAEPTEPPQNDTHEEQSSPESVKQASGDEEQSPHEQPADAPEDVGADQVLPAH